MIELLIAHSVFLTAAERRFLGTESCSIETVGMSVPAGVKDHGTALTEVLCKYLITNEVCGDEIELMPDGYKIYIDPRSCKQLLSVKEGGTEWLKVAAKSTVERDGQEYALTHQIVIQDVAELDRSTLCEEWRKFKARV